jgi:hypothetical protein
LAFLHILSLQRQTSELSFFENYYEELLRGGDFKKNINRELRQLTVGILLSNTQTALYQKAVDGLEKYVSSKSKLLGLATTTTFILPKKEDDFFSPDSIDKKFGFDVTAQNRDIDFWFLSLLTFLPPFAWETLFKTTDWDKIVGIFADLKNSAGKADSVFFKTFGIAMANSQYKPAIVAFLKNGMFEKEMSSMLNVLEINELEHFLAVKTGSLASEKLWNSSGLGVLLGTKNQAIRPAILTEIIASQIKTRPNWAWSRSFSLQILRGCFLTQDNLNAVEHTLNLTLFLHPSILDDLYQETRQDVGTDYYKNETRRRIVYPMIQIMELKKEIDYL